MQSPSNTTYTQTAPDLQNTLSPDNQYFDDMTKQKLIDALDQIKTVCEHCYFDCNGPEHNDYYVLNKALDQIQDIVDSALKKKKD